MLLALCCFWPEVSGTSSRVQESFLKDLRSVFCYQKRFWDPGLIIDGLCSGCMGNLVLLNTSIKGDILWGTHRQFVMLLMASPLLCSTARPFYCLTAWQEQRWTNALDLFFCSTNWHSFFWSSIYLMCSYVSPWAVLRHALGELCLHDIQFSLCEFDKFERAKHGEGFFRRYKAYLDWCLPGEKWSTVGPGGHGPWNCLSLSMF